MTNGSFRRRDRARPLSSRRWAVAAVLLALSPFLSASDESLFLASIPVTASAGHAGAFADEVVATLDVPFPEETARALALAQGIEILGRTDDSVSIRVGRGATMDGLPSPSQRQPSFVIDFDEPAVLDAFAAFEASTTASDGVDDLVDFVHDYITDKNYSRGFDLASRVAGSREGDCTEHAVLVAALARAGGRPSRVAIGVLLVDRDGIPSAYGHAWAEVFDGGRWRVADATLPAVIGDGVSARHLPLISLENENAGYALDLARISRVQPAAIRNVENADRK